MSSEMDPSADYSGSQHWSVVLGPWCVDAIPSSLVFSDATVETARSAKSVKAPNANHLATAVQTAGKINVGVLRRREGRFSPPSLAGIQRAPARPRRSLGEVGRAGEPVAELNTREIGIESR